MKQDVYERVTNAIVAELEKGVRPWFKPWNAEHAAGRITRPLRANGLPYRGINVLMLWGAACEHGYAAPIWMTFKQAQELGGHVRKGEKGNLVVYANKITKTETDENGQESERDIPFMKGYTVFNVEQVEGLPPTSTSRRSRRSAHRSRSPRPAIARTSPRPEPLTVTAGRWLSSAPGLTKKPPPPLGNSAWPPCASSPSSRG